MRKAAIVCAVRTPIGRYAGSLSAVRPDDLAALTIRELVTRTEIDPGLIEDIYLGATNQAGEDNRNVARMAALLAGLPERVAGCTVNRLCASGLEAINIAARMIETDHADVLIAGGVESMSRAPWVVAKPGGAFARNPEMVDSTIGWRFTNPKMAALHPPCSMGQTAENVARRYNISREAQDAFALQSQQKWAAAKEAGRFDAEIVPVSIPQRKREPIVVDTDEHPRPGVTLDTLARLPAVFADDDLGTVTPGNSSGINDGAAALLLIEAEMAARLGLKPMAIVGRSATAGVDPALMGMGPVSATRKVIERTGVTLDQIDIIELNEAFAAQSLACVCELGIEEATINPNGGAIAMGHPLGCTGARIVVTLIHEMQRTNATRGLATLCVGVGQGVATLFESPG
ncbi:3-ketoacyl-CoA thiolase @ Acetyl-CoA acetyltransferase [hydrothermal vent metagenome]|uniref:acetyl-CoA C-acyltransferase n=1 Tax=hydrothermal vent metagenome TaxID=652676 RepID=A0A3B1DAJ0_9ZZZZ